MTDLPPFVAFPRRVIEYMNGPGAMFDVRAYREKTDRAAWINELAGRWRLVRRGHRAGIYLRCTVTLTCGHGFIEDRPPNVLWPVQGELRVCVSLNHWPNVYPATYTDVEEGYLPTEPGTPRVGLGLWQLQADDAAAAGGDRPRLRPRLWIAGLQSLLNLTGRTGHGPEDYVQSPEPWRCPECLTLLRYSHDEGCSQASNP